MTESAKGVFLSYASEDAGAAKRICDALRVAGMEVWFDQSELRGGDAWDHKIRQQIRDCALFVPIISAHTQARPEGYFRLEWKLAVDRFHLMAAEKTFLVPVVVDATTESEALVPAQFRDVQWTRVQTDAVPAAFPDRIAALLHRPVAHPWGSPERGVSRVRPMRLPTVTIAISVAVVAVLLVALALRGPWLSHKPIPTVEAGTTSALQIMPTAISEKSVAVLPFVDMSEKHDQEYFSDGLSEELTDRLGNVSDLRVPARTSSFYFKGKQITIKEIGAALGVTHVLEGSVRKSGNTLRVTAQLIRVDNGYHVWSATYDRKLTDIFKIQDEISAAIIKALNLALTSGAAAMPSATSSVQANDLYLRSRVLSDDMTKDGTARQIELLRQALALDPGFARAWAELSRARIFQVYQYMDETPAEAAVAKNEARSAAERAVALAPSLASPYLALGRVHLYVDRDIAKARGEIERAVTLEPGNADAVLQLGNVEAQEGHLDAAKPLFLRANALDPLNANNMVVLESFYIKIGDGASAELIARKLGELYPTNTFWRGDLAWALLLLGKVRDAYDSAEAVAQDEYDHLWNQAMFYPAFGRAAEGDAALARLERANAKEMPPVYIAAVYAYRGNKDRAFEWLDRQYAVDPQSLALALDIMPTFIPLRGDKRFQTLRGKLKLPELHPPAPARR